MLEPILLNLEVGRYVVPILQRPLSYLLAGRRPGGNSGGNISGNSIRGGDKIRGSSGDGGKGGGGCAANTVAKAGTSGRGGEIAGELQLAPSHSVHSGQGELVEFNGGESTTKSAGTCSLKSLATLYVVLGGL